MRALMLFLSLPWWALVATAGGIASFAWSGQEERLAKSAAVEAALQAEPPAVTALKPGVRPELGDVREIILRAQVDPTLNTELVQTTNGVTTSRHAMVALVDPTASQTPEDIQALIIVDYDERERLIEYLIANAVGFGKVGPIVEVHGWLDRSHSKSSHAADALRDQGHDRADTLYYIDPFLDGRIAGLTAQAGDYENGAAFLFYLAAGIAVIGLGKFGLGQMSRRPARAPAAALSATDLPPEFAVPAAPQPGAYAALTPEEEEALTPLQKIKRRQAMAAAAVPQPAATRVGPRTSGFGIRKSSQPVIRSDAFESGPIRSTRRAKADPFDRLAEEARRG